MYNLYFFQPEKQHVHKKKACLLSDLVRIIKAMPLTLKTRLAEAALFLLAEYSGARTITCINILLKDIMRLHVSNINGKETLQIFV